MRRDKLAEAARFMTLPGRVRIARARAAVGWKRPPPWLDDDVLNALWREGFAERIERAPEAGDVVSGPRHVLELNDRGRALAREAVS